MLVKVPRVATEKLGSAICSPKLLYWWMIHHWNIYDIFTSKKLAIGYCYPESYHITLRKLADISLYSPGSIGISKLNQPFLQKTETSCHVSQERILATRCAVHLCNRKHCSGDFLRIIHRGILIKLIRTPVNSKLWSYNVESNVGCFPNRSQPLHREGAKLGIRNNVKLHLNTKQWIYFHTRKWFAGFSMASLSVHPCANVKALFFNVKIF